MMDGRRFLVAIAAVTALVPAAFRAQELSVPNKPDSVKFAAIGDNGTGDQPEYDIANQMDLWHRRFPFDMVIMLGDNLYGSQGAADFVQKFERPYKPLLDAGVKFYASLGNHDRTSNDSYRLFNMGGERYYTYARNNVRFFVLDTNYLDPGSLSGLNARSGTPGRRGRLPTSITRCTPTAAGMAPRWTCACGWSRSSSGTA